MKNSLKNIQTDSIILFTSRVDINASISLKIAAYLSFLSHIIVFGTKIFFRKLQSGKA